MERNNGGKLWKYREKILQVEVQKEAEMGMNLA